MSDVICTSSNAVKIVKALPAIRRSCSRPTSTSARSSPRSRPAATWCCGRAPASSTRPSARSSSSSSMAQHPDAEVIAHPECDERHPAPRRLHRLDDGAPRVRARRARSRRSSSRPRRASCTRCSRPRPDKTFIPAPPEDESCACNECPHMQQNTLEKLYLCAARSAAAGRCARAGARARAASRSSACSR